MKRFNQFLALVATMAGALLLSGHGYYEGVDHPNGWQSSGNGKTNTSFQSREHTINATNASQLAPKWVYHTDAAANQVNPDGSIVKINPLYPKSSVIVTPSVAKDNSAIYFTDLNGRVHAVNAQTGQRIWVKSIVYDYLAKGAPLVDGVSVKPSSLIPAGANISNIYVYSRTTPLIYNNLLIIGLRAGSPTPTDSVTGKPTITGTPTADTMMVSNRAFVMAINRSTGALVWVSHGAPDTPMSQVTGALSQFQGLVYGGASNFFTEVLNSLDPQAVQAANAAYIASGQAYKLPNGNYTCCGGSGSVFALNADTGKLVWNKPTIDPSLTGVNGFGGYSGASVWGNNIPIDPARKLVFVATGNLHNGPSTLPTTAERDPTTLPLGVHAESIIALNMKTGDIVWSSRLIPPSTMDVGSLACFLPIFAQLPQSITGCTDPLVSANGGAMLAQYTDTDFAQQPMLTEVNGKQVLIGHQKSGTVYELDPSTGLNLATFNNGLPVIDGNSSAYGGHEWGAATDGSGIYNQNTNGANVFDPTGTLPNAVLINTITGVNDVPPGAPGGYFNKIDAATGKIIWQLRDPNLALLQNSPQCLAQTGQCKYLLHASPYGGVTLANGVLFGTSVYRTFFAINAYNGQILLKFTNGTLQGTNTPVSIVGSGFAPPSIFKGTVYLPTGYAPITFGNSLTNVVDANDPFTNPFDDQVIAFSVPKASGDLDCDPAAEDDNQDINGL